MNSGELPEVKATDHSHDQILATGSNQGDAVEPPLVKRAARAPTKTPTFQAMHASRYKRQELINGIQKSTGRNLICYVAGHQAEISRDDTMFLVDLLHNIPPNEPLDLLLQTPGGDIDAAEKLIGMVRNRVEKAQLRVIVPDYAKSAGTLIALGADVAVMSDCSELGPIDPQMVMVDSNGNRLMMPIISYLEAYKDHSAKLRSDPDDPVALMMLSKLDPTRIKHFETVMRRARTIAEDLLRRGMFRSKSGGNITKVAGDLLDPARWPTHGQMISAADAVDIGLSVDVRSADDAEWQLFWQLYCYQKLDLLETGKLFESSFASLPVN